MKNSIIGCLLTLLLITCSDKEPAPKVQRTLRSLAIFYGYPSLVNRDSLGKDLTKVSQYFAKYDVVVFGGSIADPTHSQHENVKTIVSSTQGTTEVFGYIPLGNNDSLSIETLKERVDQWKTMKGLKGIFVDTVGFDYWDDDAEMRSRQNEIFTYIHSLSLKVFANGWDPDDLFTHLPKNPTVLGSGDYYLYESYIFSKSSEESFENYRNKIKKIQAALESTGVQTFGINTNANLSSAFKQEDYDFMAISALADGLSGIGYATKHFSATGDDQNILPYRTINTTFKDALVSVEMEDDVNEVIKVTVEGKYYAIDYGEKSFEEYDPSADWWKWWED